MSHLTEKKKVCGVLWKKKKKKVDSIQNEAVSWDIYISDSLHFRDADRQIKLFKMVKRERD